MIYNMLLYLFSLKGFIKKKLFALKQFLPYWSLNFQNR